MSSVIRHFNNSETRNAIEKLMSNKDIVSHVRSFLLDIRHNVKGPLDLRTVVGYQVKITDNDQEFYIQQIRDFIATMPCVKNGSVVIDVMKTVEATKVHGWDCTRVSVLDVKWELTEYGNMVLDELIELGDANIIIDRQTYCLDIPGTKDMVEIAFQNDLIIMKDLIGDIETSEDARFDEIKKLALLEKLSRTLIPNTSILAR